MHSMHSDVDPIHVIDISDLAIQATCRATQATQRCADYTDRGVESSRPIDFAKHQTIPPNAGTTKTRVLYGTNCILCRPSIFTKSGKCYLLRFQNW